MKELVNDDELPKGRVFPEEVRAKGNSPTRRARGPFSSHPLYLDALGMHPDPGGPAADVGLKAFDRRGLWAAALR